jgi:SnoaL-like polyketide cyclase
MQELIERFFDQVLNLGDHGDLHTLMMLDCPHQIDLVPGLPQGPRGLEFFLTSLRDSFAQIYYEPQKVEIHRDSFRVAFTLHGIHKGGFLAVETTGQEIKTEGIYSAQVYRGKIIHDSLELNRQEILGQLRVASAVQTLPKSKPERNRYDSYK